MKLSDNIKRIRKENNLSQEQLAEKLGVSRQSVSKWESGQSYPEMDKMLKICDMFNYNINDLLNENINIVKEEKQSKNNYNKYIEDFFSYVTKTVKMFASMKFTQKIKCLIEQIFVAFLLCCLGAIIGGVGFSIFDGLFGLLPYRIYSVLFSITKSIYFIFFALFAVVIFLHIFKIRYLDYYEIIETGKEIEIENNENDEKDNKENNDKEVKTTLKTNIKLLEDRREKIIIRDPKDSESKFLSGIVKLIMFGVKAFVCFIAFWLLLFLVFSFAALICSFTIIKSGLIFVGTLICILAAIVGDLVFIEIAYNIIVNKKGKKLRLGLQFLGAVIALGIGIGIICVDFTHFNFQDESSLQKDEYILTMKENTYIDRWSTVEFVEENRNNIRIVVLRDKYSTSNYYEFDGCISVHSFERENEFFNLIREVKDCINNKTIPYTKSKIVVYASKENISKMQENYKLVEKNREYEYYTEQLEIKDSKIEELEEEIETLIRKNEELSDLILEEEKY